MDTSFSPLSRPQYSAIIKAGTLPGYTSPMDTDADYASLIAVTKSDNMNPRWPLAFTWAEGHDGSDPGLVAARVNNLGGVKWVGQSGAYDSGIAADTGGTYAGFPDLTGYYQEFVRIMHNSIIGPHYEAGDLISAVEHYTNGPGTGHNKVTQYQAYVRDYPPEGAATVVTGQEVANAALKHLGQAREADTWNGDHPVEMMCQGDVEDWVWEATGVVPHHYASAAQAGDDGPLNSGPAPVGAQVFFRGPGWSSFDHTGVSLGDGRTISGLATVTISDGWQNPAVGYRGWRMPVGVSNQAPAPDESAERAEFPTGKILRKGLGFRNEWDRAATLGNEYHMRHFGYPVTDEYVMRFSAEPKQDRTVILFERGGMAWDGSQAAPWDITSLNLQQIAEAVAEADKRGIRYRG